MTTILMRHLRALGILLLSVWVVSGCDSGTTKTDEAKDKKAPSKEAKETPKKDEAPAKDNDDTAPKEDTKPAKADAAEVEPDRIEARPLRLNASTIKGVIRAQQPVLKACYDKARAEDEKIAGKIIANFKINADGSIADLTLKEQEFKNEGFETCFTTALNALSFPSHKGDPLEVNYPFTFSADTKDASPIKMAFAFDPVPLPAAGPQHNNDLIRAGISTLRPAICACYEARLKANQDSLLTGTVSLSFEINAEGTTDKVSVTSSALKLDAPDGAKETKDDALETCLIEQLKQLKVAGLQNPPVQVTYPFVFEPAASDAKPNAKETVDISDNTASVRKTLSKDDIRGTIRDNQAAVRACYEGALAANPKLAGKVTTTFSILPTGAVADANVSKHTFPDESVPTCVLGALQSWTFPARATGVTNVTYPFVFSAE